MYLLVFFTPLISRAQQAATWTKKIGYGLHLDGTSGSGLDRNGNLYLTGVFYGNSDFEAGTGTQTLSAAQSRAMFTCKISAHGELAWAKQFPITERNILTIDKDQQVIHCASGHGLYVRKIDAEGNELWKKHIEGTATPAEVSTDEEGNIIIAGYFIEDTDFDPDSGVSLLEGPGFGPYGTSYTAGFLLKLSAKGKFIWVRQFPVAVLRMAVHKSDIVLNYTADAVSTVIKRISPQGEDLWSRTFKSKLRFSSLAITPDGGLVGTGSFVDSVDMDPGPARKIFSTALNKIESNGWYYPDGDVFLLKLDRSGDLLWAKQLKSTDAESSSKVRVAANGKIYLCGASNNHTDLDPGPATYTLTTARGYSGFYAVYDSAGNFLCANTVFANTHPYVNTGTYDLHLDSEGYIYTIGLPGQSYFYHISKLDSCTSPIPVDNTDPPKIHWLSIFPNPSTGTFQVTADKPYNYRLTDLTGKILQEGVLKEGPNTLSVETALGIYTLSLISADGVVRAHKLGLR